MSVAAVLSISPVHACRQSTHTEEQNSLHKDSNESVSTGQPPVDAELSQVQSTYSGNEALPSQKHQRLKEGRPLYERLYTVSLCFYDSPEKENPYQQKDTILVLGIYKTMTSVGLS